MFSAIRVPVAVARIAIIIAFVIAGRIVIGATFAVIAVIAVAIGIVAVIVVIVIAMTVAVSVEAAH